MQHASENQKPSQGSVKPQSTAPNSAVEQLKHIAEKPHDLACHIISHADESICRFWLGTYKRGPIDFRELSAEDTPVREILKKASEEGITSDENILFSNCESGQTTFILLVPLPEARDQASLQHWTERVTTSLASVKPSEIGFNLSREDYTRDAFVKTLASILLHIKTSSPGFDLHKTFISSLGLSYQEILNAVFAVKKTLTQKQIKITLFH